MPDPVVEAMAAFVHEAQVKGFAPAYERARMVRGQLGDRTRFALFISGLRGHAMSVKIHLPTGSLAKCERCDMTLRVPRDQAGDAFEGRALEHDCPSVTMNQGVREL